MINTQGGNERTSRLAEISAELRALADHVSDRGLRDRLEAIANKVDGLSGEATAGSGLHTSANPADVPRIGS